ncbi:GntR family transcriptional regulator [Devosia sp. 2618]|uniref:GntR family transcriptional regulator n=1 Tax=Devosia sp. 2618 TaxID=3156454 RepID=UPI0033975FEB
MTPSADESEPSDHVPAGILTRVTALLAAADGSPDPLYVRLELAVRRLIENGELRARQTIPSERALMKATGLSRVTIRKAMEGLMDDRLIETRPGAGSQVSPYLDQPLSVLVGFTEDMARRGAVSGSRIISEAIALPTADEMLRLGLMASEEVFRVSRIRFADGEALAIEHAVVPRFAVGEGLANDSLYAALRATGNPPVRALQRLRAGIAEDWEAEHLGIERGSPILRIERHGFLANGRAIEITKSAYRGDRYDFIAELKLAT